MRHVTSRYKLSAIAAAMATAFAISPVIAADTGPAFTVSNAGSNGIGPFIARSESGDFVAVYHKFANNDDRFFARVFNADATPKGDEFEVGSSLFQVDSVAMDSAGRFAIAWSQPTTTPYSDSDHVFVQRYSADCTPQGAAIDVGAAPTRSGATTFTASTSAALAMDHDGDFVVSWTTTKDLAFDRSGYFFLKSLEWSTTYAAVYAADGSVIKAKTVIDSVLPKVVDFDGQHFNLDVLSDIAMDADGDIVAAFSTGRDATLKTAVRRYNRALRKKGGLTNLDAVQTDATTFAKLGIDANGNFGVLWTDLSDHSPHVTRYAADASFLGDTGPVETPESGDQNEKPTLSMAPSGDFIVTWGHAIPSGISNFTSWEKHAQYFHADGTTNGSSFVIDHPDAGYINEPNFAAAVDAAGNLVSIWNLSIWDVETSTIVGGGLIGRLTKL